MSAAPFVERVASGAAPRLLAFDVDGTLAPIVDDPAAARVPAAVQADLARLRGAEGVCVALVTGRDADALARVCSLDGVFRAVEHGQRLLHPDGRAEGAPVTDGERDALLAFEAAVRGRLAPRGARLETKRAARGVHVRELAKERPDEAAAVLEEAAALATAHGLRPRRGKAILEAELRPGDKGAALRRIAAATGAASLLYVGDDLTDGPALEVARAAGGVALFVRSDERPEAPAAVDGILDGPAAVAAFVSALVARLVP
jgi:trehalose 6-phosphate phosphatase